MVKTTAYITTKISVYMNTSIAVVLWFGGYLIYIKIVPVSNFVSFFASFLALFRTVKGFGNTLQNIQITSLAFDRLKEIFTHNINIPQIDSFKKIDPIISRIEYKNINFEYTPEIPVLKNINIVINKGETIAIVGNSGGGKTTFANLLPRFYEASSGTISINNINITEYDLNSLRKKISIVFQDNFLFSGTIRENIVLGEKNINNEQLYDALKNACLDSFVNSLPKGVNTEIGERGIRLSGGQKQRLAIARIFIKNSPIIILDEATSALDNKSENIVQQAISNLMKNRTIIIIAHRLSSIKNADKIFVIYNGEIVEQGHHKELIEINNHYTALYQTQTNNEFIK